ncbi:MAG: hypothetical protein WCA91_13055, partial [Candidatus Acidiferrales bacterium]
ETADQGTLCRHQHLKLGGMLAAHQALHRELPCNSLNSTLQIGAGGGAKLRRSTRGLAEEEYVRDDILLLPLFLSH